MLISFLAHPFLKSLHCPPLSWRFCDRFHDYGNTSRVPDTFILNGKKSFLHKITVPNRLVGFMLELLNCPISQRLREPKHAVTQPMIMVIGQQHGRIQKWASEIIDFRFVRIMPDGTVSYSQRLTLKGDCPMQLQKFPFDSQANSLSVYMYMYDQVRYT